MTYNTASLEEVQKVSNVPPEERDTLLLKGSRSFLEVELRDTSELTEIEISKSTVQPTRPLAFVKCEEKPLIKRGRIIALYAKDGEKTTGRLNNYLQRLRAVCDLNSIELIEVSSVKDYLWSDTELTVFVFIVTPAFLNVLEQIVLPRVDWEPGKPYRHGIVTLIIAENCNYFQSPLEYMRPLNHPRPDVLNPVPKGDSVDEYLAQCMDELQMRVYDMPFRAAMTTDHLV